jgi:hypothetical protein
VEAAVLKLVSDRLADGSCVISPNVLIGALTTQRKPSVNALWHIFRQILAMPPFPNDLPGVPLLLTNLEPCIPILQRAERDVVGCWRCCVDRMSAYKVVNEDGIRLLMLAAEEAGFPADLKSWAAMGVQGTAQELPVRVEVMEALPVISVQAILKEVRDYGKGFRKSIFVDGESAQKGRAEILQELQQIDGAVFETMSQQREYKCSGKRGKWEIDLSICEKVFRIMFGIRKQNDFPFVRLDSVKISGICAMAKGESEIILTW